MSGDTVFEYKGMTFEISNDRSMITFSPTIPGAVIPKPTPTQAANAQIILERVEDNGNRSFFNYIAPKKLGRLLGVYDSISKDVTNIPLAVWFDEEYVSIGQYTRIKATLDFTTHMQYNAALVGKALRKTAGWNNRIATSISEVLLRLHKSERERYLMYTLYIKYINTVFVIPCMDTP